MALDSIRRRSPRRARSVALLVLISAASAASLGLTTTGSATTLMPACEARPTSTAFARWGDSSSYFLMPGGGFESSAPGWTLVGGPKVVSGNENYFVNAASDTQSLSMPTGAQATSSTVCVAMGENTVRFFVKNSGVPGSVLHLQAYVRNPLTGLVLTTGFDINGRAGVTSWSPSARLLIPNLLGGVAGTQTVTLEFSTRGTSAAWNIDDVFVDPFKSR